MEHYIFNHLSLILVWIYILIILSVSIVMIHNHTKSDPIRTMMWIIVLCLLPGVGLISYIFFGQNYRKSKIFNRKALRDIKYLDRMSNQQMILLRKDDVFKEYPDKQGFKNIMMLLLNNSKALLTQYNRIKVFHDGKNTFDAIKKALLAAQDHIHLEFYIIQDDTIGRQIKDILIAKARSGVSVRVIYDDVGSWSLPSSFCREIEAAGGETHPFMKVFFPYLSSKLNYRNHRKIVVVDGKIGFMGGINIADRYIDGGKFGFWSDTHIEIEGDAVQSLQVVFLIDWFFVSKQAILNDRTRYFPEHNIRNKQLVQVITSGPDSDWACIMQAYFAMINSAKHHIYIATPYFTPNESILTALKTASLSGVDVRLLLPEMCDSHLVYWSSLSYVSDLMDAGVKVYLYHRGFNHSKFITIDGKLSAIGSANMDMRSFEHNFEISSIVYDQHLTSKLELEFQLDIQHYSRRIDPQKWKNRSVLRTFSEGFARLFTPLL